MNRYCNNCKKDVNILKDMAFVCPKCKKSRYLVKVRNGVKGGI